MNISTLLRRKDSSLKKSRKGTIRFMLVFGAMLLSPFAALAPTSSASAYNCGSSRVCFFVDSFGGGASFYGYWHNACWNMTTAYNNNISSIDNNLPYDIDVYNSANCTYTGNTEWFTVNANTEATVNGNNFPWYMNDRISSFYVH